MALSLATPVVCVTLQSSSSDSAAGRPPTAYLDLALGLDMVGDAQSLRELLELADQSLQRDVPAITQWLLQGDARAANQLLHSIKGFVPIFCTPALVQHVTRVELLSKTASAEQVQPAYAELAPALSQLCAEVRRYLDNPAAGGTSDASA
jgi:HPt (histidine-containing phosphotransfer) domain-containing protein